MYHLPRICHTLVPECCRSQLNVHKLYLSAEGSPGSVDKYCYYDTREWQQHDNTDTTEHRIATIEQTSNRQALLKGHTH